MRNYTKFLSKNTYRVHLVAFFLMIITPVLLYFAALQGISLWVWLLVGLVALANFLVLIVR